MAEVDNHAHMDIMANMLTKLARKHGVHEDFEHFL